MIGGIIEKDEKVGSIWKIKKPSKRPLVNEYRKYELLVLNEFLKDSKETDSNNALEREGGTLIGNFRAACTRAVQSPENAILLKNLEDCVDNVNNIIRLRKQEMDERKQASETQEDIDRRARHQLRVGYWEVIQPSLVGLLETTKAQIQGTLARRQEDIRRRTAEDSLRADQESLASVARAVDFDPPQLTDPKLIEKYRQEQEMEYAAKKEMAQRREEEQKAEVLKIRQQEQETAARLSKQAKEERSERDRARDLASNAERLNKEEAMLKASKDYDALIDAAIARAIKEGRPANAKQMTEEKKKKRQKKTLDGVEKENRDKKEDKFIELIEKGMALHKMGKELEAEYKLLPKKFEANKQAQLAIFNETQEFIKQEAKLEGELKVAQTKEKKASLNAALDKLSEMLPVVVSKKNKLERENDELNRRKEEIDRVFPVENKKSNDLFEQTRILYQNLDNDAFKLCDNAGCHKQGTLKCGGCRIAMYCSPECQKVDWKVRHKAACSNQFSAKKERGGQRATKKYYFRKTKRKTTPAKTRKRRTYK